MVVAKCAQCTQKIRIYACFAVSISINIDVLMLCYVGQMLRVLWYWLTLFDELCDNADEQLFDNVQMNCFHSLHNLLPPESSVSQNYTLWSTSCTSWSGTLHFILHTFLLPSHCLLFCKLAHTNYKHTLFCCSTKIMSSNLSLYLNSSLEIYLLP